MFTDALAATGNENLEFFLTDSRFPPDPNAAPPYRLVAEERGILLYMRSLGLKKRSLLGMGEPYRARDTKLNRNVAVIAGCSKDGVGMSAAFR